jgi:hypothetical protein
VGVPKALGDWAWLFRLTALILTAMLTTLRHSSARVSKQRVNGAVGLFTGQELVMNQLPVKRDVFGCCFDFSIF